MIDRPPATDEPLMHHALQLAERGRGAVEPNPLVGALLVAAGGRILGEGWHRRFGGPHAEIEALRDAAARRHDPRGSTLYVTLEPCCHHGKTPPCTDAIIAAGVRRVVVALHDPFPEVAGRGIERLKQAGLHVELGLLQAEARRLNAPYLKRLETGLPYVHAKWAMSLDGKIATAAGDSKWISGDDSRRAAHRLRARMDALIVGIGTVLKDDPLLTARLGPDEHPPRVATRVVLDSYCRIPEAAQLLQTVDRAPVLIATTAAARPADRERLARTGCEVLVLDDTVEGTAAGAPPAAPPRRVPLRPLLAELGRRRFTNVMVEGGGEVLGAFFDARLVDELHAFIAPKLIGGAAPTPFGGRGAERLLQSLPLRFLEVTRLGPDLYVRSTIEWASHSS